MTQRAFVPEFLLVLLLSTFLSCAIKERPYDSAYKYTWPEFGANSNLKSIEEELTASSTLPFWAGRYYFGDGFGVNVFFVVAPNSGYCFEWRGCIGLYDKYDGGITCKTGFITLQADPGYEMARSIGLSTALVPYKWGARYYLIPKEKTDQFLKDVATGRVSNRGSSSLYLRRIDCTEKRGWGDPIQLKTNCDGP
jgi:hypothetical protein